MNPVMERMMRAMGQEVPHEKRVLEVNPAHPLLARMRTMFDADRNDAKLADYIEILHGQALLAEGAVPKNAARFSRLVADLMAKG
jgi:molecular chaperone HtpG